MSNVLDIRKTDATPFTEIQWAASGPKGNGGPVQAFRMIHFTDNSGSIEFVQLKDRTGEFVNVADAESARNLQKALDKAIELGWLK